MKQKNRHLELIKRPVTSNPRVATPASNAGAVERPDTRTSYAVKRSVDSAGCRDNMVVNRVQREYNINEQWRRDKERS
jgi:hypothetical protein